MDHTCKTTSDVTGSRFTPLSSENSSQFIGPAQRVTFATFTAIHREGPSISADDELCINLAGHTPREHVVYSGGNLSTDSARGTNVRYLNSGDSASSVQCWTVYSYDCIWTFPIVATPISGRCPLIRGRLGSHHTLPHSSNLRQPADLTHDLW